MAFWGCVLKPGQKHPVKIEDADVLHLSQACLHDPKDGKNYLQVEVDGTAYSIACLEKGKREHDCLDLFFDSQKTTFMTKGNSEIHLMGYIEPSDFGSQEGSDSESQQVVTKAASSKEVVTKAASPKVVAASSPKISATSPKTSPKAAPQAIAEESDDDFSEDEEEEEEQMPSDEGSFMEDEEEESESPAAAPQKASQGQSPKRQATSEPQAPPAKKAKGDNAEEAGYVKKLVDYLKANGKQNGGQLGSKVPRPAGLPKMKAILEQYKDKFTVVGDMVTAK